VKGCPRRKEKEMTDMALRSRIAVLVVAALLSVAGAFGTSAFLTSDDAQARSQCTGFYSPTLGKWIVSCQY
jgi:invasion protein IalB